MDEKQESEKQPSEDEGVVLVIRRAPNGNIAYDGSMSLLEAPTVLRMVAMRIEQVLGLRE